MNARVVRARGWVGALVTSGTLTAACIGFEVDYDGFCAQRPEHPQCAGAGASGQGGVGGSSGTGGAAGGGTGGAPMMGTGGGGAGPCADDAACTAEKGEGSLCVGGACTKAAGACDATLLVVVAPGHVVDDATLSDGCHYRDLEGARAAIGATTTRLAVYVDEAVSTKALDFATAATLEGHHSDPSKAVTVTVPQVAGTPLVRFGQGGALKGVELNGSGVTTAARVEAGTLAVSGPTVLTNASPALELVGKATAAVTGTEAAPVRLSGNRRGVFVPAEATLTMQGDGKAESVVVEGTNGGAAVLFEAAGTSPCSTLSKVTLRSNTGSSGDGTGAIEVRRGRQVVVDGCTFVHNRQSITLSGAGGGSGSSVDAFLGVQLQNNVFTDALPLEPANTGSVLCGSNLGSSGTTLNVRDGNVFPGAPDTCAALPDPSQFGCDGGQVLGHSSPGMTVNPECIGGAFQCGGGT